MKTKIIISYLTVLLACCCSTGIKSIRYSRLPSIVQNAVNTHLMSYASDTCGFLRNNPHKNYFYVYLYYTESTEGDSVILRSTNSPPVFPIKEFIRDIPCQTIGFYRVQDKDKEYTIIVEKSPHTSTQKVVSALHLRELNKNLSALALDYDRARSWRSVYYTNFMEYDLGSFFIISASGIEHLYDKDIYSGL